MKGVIGCDAGWLNPGEVIGTADGKRMTILREVDAATALEIAARNCLTIQVVPGEHFYEVDIDLQAQVTNN
jgi:hypothetical protein